MTKREMILELVNRLLDVEESGTKKVLHFGYNQKIGLDFHFNECSDSKEWVRGLCCVYFDHGWDNEQQFKKALAEIELIKTIPEAEPKVSLTLTIEKAKELGLIA